MAPTHIAYSVAVCPGLRHWGSRKAACRGKAGAEGHGLPGPQAAQRKPELGCSYVLPGVLGLPSPVPLQLWLWLPQDRHDRTPEVRVTCRTHGADPALHPSINMEPCLAGGSPAPLPRVGLAQGQGRWTLVKPFPRLLLEQRRQDRGCRWSPMDTLSHPWMPGLAWQS